MKRSLLYVLTLFFALSVLNFAQVQLKFVTVTAYGNNLYIDNVSAGNQLNLDAGVIFVNNINPDTNYTASASPLIIAPNVPILNAGKQNITTPFTVTMTATPGGYTSTKTISSLNSGEIQAVTFDDLSITLGEGINITVTTNLTDDENPANDTFEQYSIYYTGIERTILLEEWTSSTCPPCASNNPAIDAFVAARFDSLVPIKYHMNWPAPGNDPMYLYNPTQANDRRFYYGVNGVPHVIMDGLIHPPYPYTTPSSLPGAYYPRKNIATPISMSVTDTRIANGDSIRADITIQVISPLITGDYYLRVHAIERHIHYNSPPGTNGEKDFYDVFRRAYPTSLGTPVPTTIGTHNFSFTYAIDQAVWVDSMIYTAAFVQNDATKEVWNSAKGRNVVLERLIVNNQNNVFEKPAVSPDVIEQLNPQSLIVNTDEANGVFSYELFEGDFPPAGWTILNPNGDITFDQFTGANGPSLGGNKSVRMDFYSYSAVGRSDTLISKVFSDLSRVDSVKFNYAYAQYQNENDRLIVKLSIDGGLTFPHTIFDKAGAQLATAPPTTSVFVPTNASQWGTFSYSLDTNITVQSPNGGEVWVVGETEDITWTSQNVNDVMIELSVDNGATWNTIESSIANTETYPWTIAAQDSSDECLIRITDVVSSSVSDVSDAVFTIDILSSIKNDNEDIPTEFGLVQNYPNPFNPSTIIKYTVPESSPVSIGIYDLTGQEVTVLVNEVKQPGTYEIEFNAENLASGVYIYRMIAGSFVQVKKMSLLK
jgi:hypothetical protein